MIVGGKTAIEKTHGKFNDFLRVSEVCVTEFVWYGGECTKNNMESIIPFIIGLMIAITILTFIPQISTFLPDLLRK
jgi:hypothetical protein